MLKIMFLLLIVLTSVNANSSKYKDRDYVKKLCVEAGFFPKANYSISPEPELITILNFYRDNKKIESIEAKSDICHVALKKISAPASSGKPSKSFVPSLVEIKSGINYADKRMVYTKYKTQSDLLEAERMVGLSQFKIIATEQLIEQLNPIVLKLESQKDKHTLELKEYETKEHISVKVQLNNLKIIEDLVYEARIKIKGSKKYTKGIVKSLKPLCVRCNVVYIDVRIGEESQMMMRGDTPIIGIVYTQLSKVDITLNTYYKLYDLHRASSGIHYDMLKKLKGYKYQLKELNDDHPWLIKKLEKYEVELKSYSK